MGLEKRSGTTDFILWVSKFGVPSVNKERPVLRSVNVIRREYKMAG